MAEPATKKKEKISSLYPDWSQLPEELLHLISTHLKENNCFDVVHARSVCTSWRSAFPFPSSLLRSSYSFPKFPPDSESKELSTLEKVPLFLFRVRADAAKYFWGRISRDGSDDHMKLLLPSPLQCSPLQCSVKVKTGGCKPTFLNMFDCQIIPLGHKCRMIIGRKSDPVAVIPLNKEGGGGGFIVLRSYFTDLKVLTSVEKRWKWLKNIPNGGCTEIVTFRSRFYAKFTSRKVVAIDPYSLEVTLLLPLPQSLWSYLVPCGDDELFLVEGFFPALGLIDISRFRVSKLDEKTGTWVEVKDLGDRSLFVGGLGNVSFSAKELPHGCGLNGNSILFVNETCDILYAYKYSVQTGNTEGDLYCWRSTLKNRVVSVNRSRSFLTLRVIER